MPAFRTHEYAVWRACERFGLRPPGVMDSWEDTLPWYQTQLLAFDQIRTIEDVGLLAPRGLL